jgi:plastocyanin
MRDDRSPWRWLTAAALVAAVVTMGACGGGEEAAAPEAPAPAAEGGATAEGGAPAGGAATPGNPAVAALGDGTATVRGTVTYEGQVPQLRPLSMDADPQCAAKHQGPVANPVLWLGPGNTLGNIFVKVASGLPEKQWPAPTQPAVIDQQGCAYHPHVIGVMAGQPLRFLNSDDLLHNVHGLPDANREFNLGMPGSLKQKDVVLETPEPLFPVKCDVHPWMQAYAAVMSHPYFATTAEDGQFEIRNLPAGTYELEAWHERMGTRTATVTVEDGGTATADFSFAPPQS